MAIRKKILKVFNSITIIFTIFFCFIFAILFLGNLVYMISGLVKPNEPPHLFKTTCLIVNSNSMSGDASDHIEVNDLIFVKKIDESTLAINDIVAYKDENIIITHRIVAIDEDENGNIIYTTKGDANNILDTPITKDVIIGKYYGRIPQMGRIIMVLQSPLIGMLLIAMIVMLIILLILIHYEQDKEKVLSTLSIQRKNKKNVKEVFELWKEKKEVE